MISNQNEGSSGGSNITIEDMSFGYNGSDLFNGLNLTMEKGNIYGLLGLNGAGKTTLMKLLTGLLFPQSGTVRVMGEDPTRRHPGYLSRIFVLPEELHAPSLSEKEYLASKAPFYPLFNKEQFERYMGEFEIPRNKKLSKLSYGQKKKFLLSFGLACGSELVVMDEPTNGLDIPSKGLFRRLVAEALTDERIFIISTHQVRDVDTLIDPITILHEGRVLFEHGMAEVSERIRMTRDVTPPSSTAEGLIYSEASVGGYWSVWKGADVAGGPIDLEILFNTVIARPDLYAEIFRAEGVTA
jgi:ABC-2 type transport system ATP-binding protein